MGCDVCGTDTEETIVSCSACGPVSFSYCTRCGMLGYEPYQALVGAAVGLGGPLTGALDIFAEWFRPIVKRSLEFHNVSIQGFIEDIDAATKEYMEA